MNKKLFALAVLFCTLLVFGACSKDDDEVDEEWKAYNEELLKDAIANGGYTRLKSLSENGYVYWKNTDFFDDDKAPSLKITELGKPYSSDSVVARYEGWYYLKDGTKVTFDTTEGDANATTGRGFRISGMDSNGSFSGVIDGWITMLTNMKVGDAVEVCIPHRLAYGTYGKTDSYGYQTIPGYTTLWFNIKLLKIIPDNADEYKK